MKNIAYNLIIKYINEHNLDGFARAYIQGVNDMLEAITTAESTTESASEPEPENRCIDVDAGESEDGPEYDDDDDDEPITTECIEPKSVTTVTKQGVKVRTSNIDIGHLVSLRSKGMTYKQIGDRLGIAPSTVCTLYKKYLSQFE